jgi:hypothetical protein
MGDVSGAADLCGHCSSCDLGSWGKSNKAVTTKGENFDALRARVEAAKRRNAQGE